ncbi:uncharacterized protein haspin [Salarias fasciatus]|uniref:uncharacterized protein haspin n=1 Tax=Salarias fasciatus TaxID=181472 RepID=UPI001176F499|nr:serine/threonine-protein kinase haspin [Salarias fasciatus]
MRQFKPVLLKTYGKQRRKLSAWISPENRKQAFDSSGSSNGSAFESPKQKKTRKKKAGVRKQRAAKEKAMRHLTEKSDDDGDTDDEENVGMPTPPPPLLFQQTRRSKPQTNTQIKKTFSGRKAQERKVIPSQTESSNLKENSENRSASPARLSPQGKMRRKTRLVSVPRAVSLEQQQVSFLSDKEASAPKRHKNSALMNPDVVGQPPSAGHFVTRRRRAPTKPQLPKVDSLIDSLDDFTSGAFCAARIHRPSRRRRNPPAFESSSDNSPVTAAVFNTLQEISLNALPDSGLRRCPQKPIFCSTPSARLLRKRAPCEPSPIDDRSALSSSVSVSSIRDLSSSQENLGSPSHSAIKQQKEADLHNHAEPSAVLSAIWLSADSASNCQFVTARGELEQQVETLKEKCLTEFCSVRLEGLDCNALSERCTRTTYPSCLELSSSVHCQSGNEQPQSRSQAVDPSSQASLHLQLSLTNHSFHSETDLEEAVSMDDGHSAFTSPFPAKRPSSQEFMELPESALDSPTGVIESKMVEDTAILTALLKEECLTRKPAVHVKRTSRSQLKEILQFKDTALKSPAVSSSADDEQMTSDPLSGNDSLTPKADVKNQGPASFEGITTEKDGKKYSCNAALNRKQLSVAHKDNKMSAASNRPGTSRKACVSGLSVSRWKNKGSARAADCSITEFISKPQQHPLELQKLLGSTVNFSTPLRATRLNLSSLMADFTPSTPTWSRLKSKLSLHRKMLLTPKYLASGSPETTELSDISRDLFAMPVRTPIFARLQSQLHSSHSLVDDLSDAEKVYAECGQQQPLSWEECIRPQSMKKCVKIGEGTFGEVFTTTNPSGETVALKVIPLEGAEKVNGEDQKTFGEILHEIIISKELSSLKEKPNNQTHGFIGLKDLHCVQGCYPPYFIKAWDAFDRRKGSENDRPDFFEEDQFFLILEFEFGGVDLENSNGKLASLVVAKSVLHQVTAALAVAEQELHFEHRDLHWGNVLVKTTKQKTESFLLNGTAHHVDTEGVLVRIIDYSLSRLEIDSLTVSCDISNDEELFMGQGDYQFEIYRLMRQENGNNWSSYHPHTNVLWLHYLSSKLLSMKYRSRGKKDVRKELTRFHHNVLQYGSATEVLQNDPLFE